MRGECFGLLGPNGAGKTTTIEILEGLLPPDAGDVEVLGLRWDRDAALLRPRLGIQLQETQLSDKLTVAETLRLFCSFYASGPTVDALLDIVNQLGQDSAVDTLRGPITGVVQGKGGAGALLGIGLVGAIWSASGYIGAFTRASNAIYEQEEGRPFWKLRPLQILLTLVMVVLLALVAMSLVVTGPLAHAIGNAIGLGATAVTIWNWAKWPVLAVIVMLMFALLYWTAPNVRQPGFRWITPGSVVAVVIWIVASAVFGVYVALFGSYNKTYGSLGGVIVFLTWLWITNIIVLLGAELNSEMERSRAIRSGHPPEEEPYLPLRDEPKTDG